MSWAKLLERMASLEALVKALQEEVRVLREDPGVTTRGEKRRKT
jgi:hypothetical protein